MSDTTSPSSQTSPASHGSPFWRFSLAFYRLPGVADACIALQENAGVDVNLLLFLLWQAAQKRVLAQSDVAALEARIGPWREGTVIPLRGVRRTLKAPPDLVAPQIAEAYRTRIKAVELEAERLQQEAMYDLARGVSFGREANSAADAAGANIAAYQALMVTFPQAAVETVLAAFTKSNLKEEI